VPESDSGFHRVGFYSNVDPAFLPVSERLRNEFVSIYVEKAYKYGERPSQPETAKLIEKIIEELKNWGWIDGAVAVADPTWVDVAYTWTMPKSGWRSNAIQTLANHNIFQVGRYAQWAVDVVAQGIAESVRQGLVAGAALRALG
jgi:hypothetical protein